MPGGGEWGEGPGVRALGVKQPKVNVRIRVEYRQQEGARDARRPLRLRCAESRRGATHAALEDE